MPRAVPTYRPLHTSAKRDHRAYDRFQRDRTAKAFYHSQAWKQLRLVKLAETPYCERCYREDRLTPATTVHHIRELSEAWDERLNLANLESLCASCHSRHHSHPKEIGES